MKPVLAKPALQTLDAIVPVNCVLPFSVADTESVHAVETLGCRLAEILDPLTVPATVPPSFWLAFGDVNVHVPVNCDPDCVSTSCNVAALVKVTLTGPVHVPANGVDGDDDENGFKDESPEQPDRASVTESHANAVAKARTSGKIRRTVLITRIGRVYRGDAPLWVTRLRHEIS